MIAMGVPLSMCAFATWNRHVKGHHSTRHNVVRLIFRMWRGYCCESCCRMRAIGVWWAKLRLLRGGGSGLGWESVGHACFILILLLRFGVMKT